MVVKPRMASYNVTFDPEILLFPHICLKVSASNNEIPSNRRSFSIFSILVTVNIVIFFRKLHFSALFFLIWCQCRCCCKIQLKMASIYFSLIRMRRMRLTRCNVTVNRCVVALKNVNKQMHETTLPVTHSLYFCSYSNIHNKNRWVLSRLTCMRVLTPKKKWKQTEFAINKLLTIDFPPKPPQSNPCGF